MKLEDYTITINSARGKYLASYKVRMTKEYAVIFARGILEGVKIRHKMPQVSITDEKNNETIKII